MGSNMKDEGGERIVHREGAGKKEADPGRGHYELVSPLFMRRLAVWLEKGAKKYDARNWENGIPMGRIIRSLLRHTYQYLEGMRDEDHLAAISCNIMFLIHFEVGIERGLYTAEDAETMQDLPNYVSKIKETLAEVLGCEVSGCCHSKAGNANVCRAHLAEQAKPLTDDAEAKQRVLCKISTCGKRPVEGQFCVDHKAMLAFPCCIADKCLYVADHGDYCAEHQPKQPELVNRCSETNCTSLAAWDGLCPIHYHM